MNEQAVLLQALALLLDKLGYKGKEGKELYFSDELIAKLSGYGQLQVERHPEKPGFVVRYLANQTIEAANDSGLSLPEPENPQS